MATDQLSRLDHTMKTKFFRVATEGATTDGRQIERSWIEQIVKNFDQKKYGARVWMEHLRGLYPDSMFKAYGDVIAVKSEKVEDGKLALFAQIDPTPELVEMTKKRQKIYSSIEVNPKFADTGEAYLVGLAVTDSPASLGTEMLAFSATQGDKSPLAGRKTSPDCLFSAAVPVDIEFEEDEAGEDSLTKFKARLAAVVEKFKKRATTDDARINELAAGFESFADEVLSHMEEGNKELAKQVQALSDANKATADALKALTDKLDKQEDTNYRQRPPATGGGGSSSGEKTDC